jgi:hypothetical protein
MHGRIIRPALVEVARQPASEPEDTDETMSAEGSQTVESGGADIVDEAAAENVGP